jgi:CheY-like chemotaxis protein
MDIDVKASVLIVDSAPRALEMMKELLHGRYHVKLAAGGAEALRSRLLPTRRRSS